MRSVNVQPERQDCSWTASAPIDQDCLLHVNQNLHLKSVFVKR